MSPRIALFPGGAIGAGILLLRLAVAASIMMLTSASFSSGPRLLGILAAVGLCVGLLTRVMAGLSILAYAFVCMLTATWEPMLVRALASAALVLTGPGAHSLDALLFGRRTISLGGGSDPKV